MEAKQDFARQYDLHAIDAQFDEEVDAAHQELEKQHRAVVLRNLAKVYYTGETETSAVRDNRDNSGLQD